MGIPEYIRILRSASNLQHSTSKATHTFVLERLGMDIEWDQLWISIWEFLSPTIGQKVEDTYPAATDEWSPARILAAGNFGCEWMAADLDLVILQSDCQATRRKYIPICYRWMIAGSHSCNWEFLGQIDGSCVWSRYSSVRQPGNR